MGDNKYINFFSDDSIHIFVGNHLNRNNIGPSHRSNIPTNAENVLTKEIIRQEITTAIENAQDKPITFTLNTSNYKADTNINPDAQELSLEDGLKEIIYFLKTKSNEKSTFNVFLETNNNTLVKDKLFDIYNAVSDSSTGLEKQEDSYPKIDIVSQTGSSQNLRISTDSVKTDENSDKHKVTSKETELSDTPNNDSDSSVLNKSKEPQPVTYNIKELNKNKKLLNKFIIAIFTEKNSQQW